MKRRMVCRVAVLIAVGLLTLAGGDDDDDKIETKKFKQGDKIDIFKKLKTPVGTVTVLDLRKETGKEDPVHRDKYPPIRLVYQGTIPDSCIRWIQIIVRTQPRRLISTNPPIRVKRPNFDGFLTKGEAKAIDPSDANAVAQGEKRKTRIRTHNPFFPLVKDTWFRDKPWQDYTLFETYIVLCHCCIHEEADPGKWKAEILGVWRWKAERNKTPELESVTPSDSGFKKASKGANADFDNAFEFDRWYPGKCPPSKL